MASSLDYTFVTVSSNCENIGRSSMIQDFLLVWLDKTIDEIHNSHHRTLMMKLREIVNVIHIFNDIDKCVKFLSEIKEEKVFVISSGSLGCTAMSFIHDMPQIIFICIFCGNKAPNELWARNWPKITGVFTDIESVYTAVKQTTERCSRDCVSMRFVRNASGIFEENLDQLDKSFMYTQIFKDILLTIDFSQSHFQEFFKFCREQFVGPDIPLQTINKLEKEYRCNRAIWWYTCHSFLYSMLNQALRNMEVNIIIKMGFFICDLHRNLTQLHFEQYINQKNLDKFTAFRGQVLSQVDFDQLKKHIGGLISFNNFLSVTTNSSVARQFACPNNMNPNSVSILFVMQIDPSIRSTPFANIQHLSCFKTEEEILFSMHSIFRICQVECIDTNPCLWRVDLTLTCDKIDKQLSALTERIREETFPNLNGWHRLTELLLKLGQFNLVEQVCQDMLVKTSSKHEIADICHRLGIIKRNLAKYNEAIESYQKSIMIKEKILSKNSFDLAASYGGLGSVYDNIDDHSQALKYYEKAHKIFQIICLPNDFNLATSYSNMGVLFTRIGEYSRAFSFLQTACTIREEILPSKHPHLAISYNHIGVLYTKMNNYTKALEYHEKARKICEVVLPSDHPNLSLCYTHIGNAYNGMDNYSEALKFHKKAKEICERTLSENHSQRAFIYDNMGLVYCKMSDYPRAIYYHATALEMYQKVLPNDHLDLGTCHYNLGKVKHNDGKYTDALSFYQEALQCYEQKLKSNDPKLLLTHENIADVYEKLEDYTKAISHYETVLAAKTQQIPLNYFDLAFFYQKIGLLHEKKGDHENAILLYLQAINVYKTATELPQHTLTDDHIETEDFIHLQPISELLNEQRSSKYFDPTSAYEKLSILHKNMGDHSKAAYYYNEAVRSRQQTEQLIPSNVPSSNNETSINDQIDTSTIHSQIQHSTLSNMPSCSKETVLLDQKTDKDSKTIVSLVNTNVNPQPVVHSSSSTSLDHTVITNINHKQADQSSPSNNVPSLPTETALSNKKTATGCFSYFFNCCRSKRKKASRYEE